MTSNFSASLLSPPSPPPSPPLLLSANYSMLPLFLWLQGGSTTAIDYYAPSAPLSVTFAGYEPLGGIPPRHHQQQHNNNTNSRNPHNLQKQQHHQHHYYHHRHGVGGRTVVADGGGRTTSAAGNSAGGQTARGAEWNSPYHPVLQMIGWIVSALLSLETVVGNAMVIVAYRIERSISKQVSNRFIVSLAVSDLIIGIEGIPLFTVYVINGDRWPLGKMACETWLFLDYTLCLVSILTVLLITVDRYLSVCHTAKYLKWQNPVKIQFLILFSWLIPALIFGVMIYGWPFLNAADEEDVTSAARTRGDVERLPASSPDIRRVTVNASRRDADGNVRTDVFSASASTASRMKMLSKIQTNANGECFAPFLSNPYVNMSMYVAYYWTTLIAMLILYKGIHKAAKKLEKRAKAKEHRHIALLLTQRLGTQVGVSLMLQSKKREEELLMTSGAAAVGTVSSNATGAFATRPPAKAEVTRDSGYNTNTLSTTCGSGGLNATTSDVLGFIPTGIVAPKTSTVLPPITLHHHRSRPHHDVHDSGDGGGHPSSMAAVRSSTDNDDGDGDDDDEAEATGLSRIAANHRLADDIDQINAAPVRKRSATYGGPSTQLEEEAAAAAVDGRTVGIYRRQVGGGGGRWLTRLRIGRLRSWSQSACEAFVQQLPPVQRRRFTFLSDEECGGAPRAAPITRRNAPPDQLDGCALSAASSMVQLDASSESSSEFDVSSRSRMLLKSSCADKMADCDAFVAILTQTNAKEKHAKAATATATIASTIKAYSSMGGGGIFAARNLLFLGPPNTPDYQEPDGNDGEEPLTPPSPSLTSRSSAAASLVSSRSSTTTTTSSSSSTSSASVTPFSSVLLATKRRRRRRTKMKCRRAEASAPKLPHSASYHHRGEVPDATSTTQRMSRSATASPFLASSVGCVEHFQWNAFSTTTVVEREAVSPSAAKTNVAVATRQQSNATTASCSAAEPQRAASEEAGAVCQRHESVNTTSLASGCRPTGAGDERKDKNGTPAIRIPAPRLAGPTSFPTSPTDSAAAATAGRGGAWWINVVGRRISGMLSASSPRRATTMRLSADGGALAPKRSLPPTAAQPVEERQSRRRFTIRSTSCSSTSSTSSSPAPANRRAAPPGNAIAALVMRHRPPTAVVQSAPAPPDQRYAAQLLPKRHSSSSTAPAPPPMTTPRQHQLMGGTATETTAAASLSGGCVVSTRDATSSAFLSVGAPSNEFGRKLSSLTRNTGDRLVQSVFAPITAFNRIRKRTRAEKRAHKAFRTITFIVGLFAILWSPYYVVATIYGFCRGECISSVVYNLSYYMCYLNSSGNPFAYALANRQFRSAFLRMFRGDFNRIA